MDEKYWIFVVEAVIDEKLGFCQGL